MTFAFLEYRGGHGKKKRGVFIRPIVPAIATLSLKSGVDVKTLSGALGHYSAGFTLNTYTHATAQMRQDAADTIGGVISQQMR